MNATTHYNGEETNSIKLKRKQLTFNNRSLEPSFLPFSNRTWHLRNKSCLTAKSKNAKKQEEEKEEEKEAQVVVPFKHRPG